MGATSVEIFRLKGEVTIRDGARLAADLQAAINSGDVLLVDASGLSSMDICTLQLLIAAHKSARALGKSLAIQAPSDGVLDALLKRSGAATALGASLVWDGDLWTGVDQAEGDAA